MYQHWHAEQDVQLSATHAVLKRFGTVSKWAISDENCKLFDALVKEGMACFDHVQEVWRPL